MFNPLTATYNAYQEKFGPIIQHGNAHSAYSEFSALIQGPKNLPVYFKKGSVTQAQASQSLKYAQLRLCTGLAVAAITVVGLAILAIGASVASVAFIANPIALSILAGLALVAAVVSLIAHAKFKNSIQAELGSAPSAFSGPIIAPVDGTPLPEVELVDNLGEDEDEEEDDDVDENNSGAHVAIEDDANAPWNKGSVSASLA